jgi:hypothetical protein
LGTILVVLNPFHQISLEGSNSKEGSKFFERGEDELRSSADCCLIAALSGIQQLINIAPQPVSNGSRMVSHRFLTAFAEQSFDCTGVEWSEPVTLLGYRLQAMVNRCLPTARIMVRVRQSVKAPDAGWPNSQATSGLPALLGYSDRIRPSGREQLSPFDNRAPCRSRRFGRLPEIFQRSG